MLALRPVPALSSGTLRRIVCPHSMWPLRDRPLGTTVANGAPNLRSHVERQSSCDRKLDIYVETRRQKRVWCASRGTKLDNNCAPRQISAAGFAPTDSILLLNTRRVRAPAVLSWSHYSVAVAAVCDAHRTTASREPRLRQCCCPLSSENEQRASACVAHACGAEAESVGCRALGRLRHPRAVATAEPPARAGGAIIE